MTASPLIHLNTSTAFKQHAVQSQSQLIINAFIKSCKALDASIFEPFMEDENVFEDKSKYLFLAELKSLFDSYKNREHLSYDIYDKDGTCAGCLYGRSIKVFSVILVGRQIFKDKFAFVIEQKDGILMDIFRCNLFSKE